MRKGNQLSMFSTMVYGSLLALVTMVTLVSCEVTQREFSSVLDRLDLMEKELLQQNDVNQQLRQQNDALAVQLSDLDRMNLRLMSKLTQQEDRLYKQEKIIRQQSSRLSQQNRIITKRLSKNCSPAVSLKPTTPQSLDEQDSGTLVTSTHHDVIARSDDTGAVGVVVNEMRADIQALKNTDIKHASDIQALKSSHAYDIQALKASHAHDIEALKASQAYDIKAVKAFCTSNMSALTSPNQHQDQDINDARASSFVRWGSSHCPHNSSLVYSGVVGGSHYKNPGAAINYMCLTMSPVFGSDRSLTYMALLYGGEYQTYDSNNDKDPVCAVCRASFSTTIMIPGTNVCTSGWTPLYSGYLMASEEHQAAASEYVCVDAALESSPGTVHDDNGKLFFFTKTRCGSLPCGPYVNDKVVTCVVCGQ